MAPHCIPDVQCQVDIGKIAPISVAAAGSVAVDDIDIRGFSHVGILVRMGVGDSALATTIEEGDAAAGARTAALNDAATPAQITANHLATSDGELRSILLRTDRRKSFLKITVAATGGAASLVAVEVIGFNQSDSRNVPGSWDIQV